MGEDSLNLAKGSVRAILAISLVSLLIFAVVWILWHIKWDSMEAKTIVPIILSLIEKVVILILGFYFITRAATAANKGGDTS